MSAIAEYQKSFGSEHGRLKPGNGAKSRMTPCDRESAREHEPCNGPAGQERRAPWRAAHSAETMEKDFDVEVVHRQRTIYRVRAADRETAERIAGDRWRSGDSSDLPGYAWSELVSSAGQASADPERARQDVEVVYRFLHERERLIQQLGGDPFNPSANDAISASQVASDLGWARGGIDVTPTPDAARATAALETLCSARRVVCFARPRMRARERGEIRLYCTPEYLERLSADLTVAEAQTA